MGIRWIWDYRARKWVGHSLVGDWHLWQHDQKWLLVSPTGTVYTLEKRDRLAAYGASRLQNRRSRSAPGRAIGAGSTPLVRNQGS